MKSIKVFLPLLIFSILLLTACNTNSTPSNTLPTNVPATSEPTAGATPTSTTMPSTTPPPKTFAEVRVSVSAEKPKKSGMIYFVSIPEGEQYIEFAVKGTITDFKLIKVVYDSASNEIIEKSVAKTIDKIQDQSVVIKTIEPEGSPMEKVTWKSSSGKTYEYLVSYNGLTSEPKVYIIK